jgi:hypothetical protein
VIFLLFLLNPPLAIIALIAKSICEDSIEDEKKQAELKKRQEEEARRKAREEAEKHIREEERNGILSLKKGKAMTIGGCVGLGAFGLAFLTELLDYGFLDPSVLVTLLVFAAGFGLLAYAGRNHMKRARRLRRLVDYIGDSRCVRLDQLADMMDYRQKDLKQDLRLMLDHGFFRGAFIDDENSCFRWMDAGVNLKKKQKKAAPAPEELAKSESGKYYQAVLISGFKFRISDPAVCEKLDLLAARTQAIFEYLDQHPKKREKARMFENHYFPTTVKILESYANFEKSGVRGENVDKAMRQVEEILDTLILCYEKQLDCLYADEALNVTAEVKVIENLLAQDGLGETLTLKL